MHNDPPPDLLYEDMLYDELAERGTFETLLQKLELTEEAIDELKVVTAKAIERGNMDQLRSIMNKLPDDAIDERRLRMLFGEAVEHSSPGTLDVIEEFCDLTEAIDRWYEERTSLESENTKLLRANRLLRQHCPKEYYESVIEEHKNKGAGFHIQADFRRFDQGDEFGTNFYDMELKESIEAGDVGAVQEVVQYASVNADIFYRACRQNRLDIVRTLLDHYSPQQSVRDRALLHAFTGPTKESGGDFNPDLAFFLLNSGSQIHDQAGPLPVKLAERFVTQSVDHKALSAGVDLLVAIGFELNDEEAEAIFDILLSSDRVAVKNEASSQSVQQSFEQATKTLLSYVLNRRHRPKQAMLQQAPGQYGSLC